MKGAKKIIRLEDIVPQDYGCIIANGEKRCPICGQSFLYGRSTKETCGKSRCARLNRRLKKITRETVGGGLFPEFNEAYLRGGIRE